MKLQHRIGLCAIIASAVFLAAPACTLRVCDAEDPECAPESPTAGPACEPIATCGWCTVSRCGTIVPTHYTAGPPGDLYTTRCEGSSASLLRCVRASTDAHEACGMVAGVDGWECPQ